MRRRDPKKEMTIRRKVLELIVRSGLDGFSMQRLAKAARVSPATLYIYFVDRDDLVFQVYREQMELMTKEALRDFDPDGPFEAGLRVQWKNRAGYALSHPLEAQFLEQVRHSPYFSAFRERLPQDFFAMMRRFAMNAIARKEMNPMPPEIFWSLAYAPLYQLVRFAQQDSTFFGHGPGHRIFQLDDATLEHAFRCVLQALRPSPPSHEKLTR
jgi:TetR/AcrR family transcriptional repressor of multidrug resistance operon